MMVDPRVTRLAELLVGHSIQLNSSDRLLLHAFDMAPEVVAEVVRVAQTTGAQVAVRLESNLVKRQLLLGMTEANAKTIASAEVAEMELMTAYIALRGTENFAEQSDVPSDKLGIWARHYSEPVVFGIRVPKTKWVVLRWPTPAMAQQAGQSTPAFEKFYFDVCTFDYAKMARAAAPLQDLMNKTDVVRLVGPGTDLTFSIAGVGSVACTGARNIPDGECFSAPVRESGNGTVTYNTATVYQGSEFKNVRFRVERGKIVEAEAGEMSARLNEILDTDEGARYFGEFAIGFNPHILHPMKDTLFDEKIAGSFHLTPGNSYDPPGGNGNKSGIHWDIVNIQRPDYGGGEIWFDGRLVRKDGIFVVPELAELNPDRLA
jgi:aminopeptidase